MPFSSDLLLYTCTSIVIFFFPNKFVLQEECAEMANLLSLFCIFFKWNTLQVLLLQFYQIYSIEAQDY